MTNDETYGGRAPRRLERSVRDRVLGGVCAGIAHHVGVDSLLLRIAAVVLVFASGGLAILVYLVAWMVIPPASDEQVRRSTPPRSVAENGGARDAWTAAGGQLRSLAGELRAARPDPRPAAGAGAGMDAVQRERSRAAAVDEAMTKLGDRLRDPEVRSSARRAAGGLSTAVGASVDELSRRGRRSPSAPGDGPVT